MSMVPSTGADWPADLSTGAAAANSYSVHPPQGLDLLHDARTSHMYQLGAAAAAAAAQDSGAAPPPAPVPVPGPGVGTVGHHHHPDLSSQSQRWLLGSHHEAANNQRQHQESLSLPDASPNNQHAGHAGHPACPQPGVNDSSDFYHVQPYNNPVGDFDYQSLGSQASAQYRDYLASSHAQHQANDPASVPPRQRRNEPSSAVTHMPASYHPGTPLDSAGQPHPHEQAESVLPRQAQQPQPSRYARSAASTASTIMPPPAQLAYAESALSRDTLVPRQIAGPAPGPVAEPKAVSPSKKRRRSSDEDADGNDGEPKDRKRGRPRLTTKDETAIERRRTQIRMAQRAYRNRKDNAITDLEQKVKDLEKSQSDMSNEVSSFFDMIHSQPGALERDPEVARRFRELHAKFLGTGKGQLLEANSCSSSSTQEETSRRTGAPLAGSETASRGGAATHDNASSSFAAYEVITKPTTENASWPSFAPANPDSRLSDWNHVYAPVDFRNTLPPPSSYADQEATFGRRLQRFTLEQGIKLITMPDPPVEIFTAVFGFCLTFETKEGIVKRLKDTLKSLRQESLYYWEHPFHSLGGAGTHLTPESGRDEYNLPIGNQGFQQIKRPSLQTGYSMGPWPPQLEQIREMRLDERMRIIFPGFTGYFLDSDEVEIYLRRRGITIPPRADYLTADINPSKFAGTVEVPEPKSVKDSRYNMVRDASAPDPGPPPMDTAMPFLCPAIPAGMFQKGAEPGTIKVTLDINTLICELANRSVCLGRTPGTRPPDIDKAVKIAAGIEVH